MSESAYPVVIPSVHIPLNVVVVALRRKRLESVAVCNAGSLVVCLLFVLLVVTVVAIDLLLLASIGILELVNLPSLQIYPARAWNY